jgi:hypothetical protein
VLIGRDCSKNIVNVCHGVAVGDDLTGVSKSNPTTAKLFEERRVHGLKGISRSLPRLVRPKPFGVPVEHSRDPLPD